MIVALIHWRVKLDEASVAAFREHWRTKNSIADRSKLVAEFLSESLPIASFPCITWHLDPDSTGDFRSFVTVGIWEDTEAFHGQVAQYFNDGGPLHQFEQYRRRRVIFNPVEWRWGGTPLPTADSAGVR